MAVIQSLQVFRGLAARAVFLAKNTAGGPKAIRSITAFDDRPMLSRQSLNLKLKTFD